MTINKVKYCLLHTS